MPPFTAAALAFGVMRRDSRTASNSGPTLSSSAPASTAWAYRTASAPAARSAVGNSSASTAAWTDSANIYAPFPTLPPGLVGYAAIVAWWFRRRRRPTNQVISISDPAVAEWFAVGSPNYAGVVVGESTALGISAFYRGVALIAGTIAGLPLRTIRDVDGKTRQRLGSFLDDPGDPVALTPFSWKETVVAHLVLHGNAYLEHVYNGAGGLVGLAPIHPLSVSPEWDKTRPGFKRFDVTLQDGQRKDYDRRTMTQIMGLSLDGLRGLSVISIARNGLGTTIAADRAAARVFASGGLIAGMVTPDEDVEEEEAKKIKASVEAKLAGWEHAGEVVVVNRKMKFTPWTMSMQDAQFLESRAFQVEEIARWLGIPPHLLAQTEKQTSWGSGVAEQNRGLSVFNLSGWTGRMEEALSKLLPAPRFVEFDFAGFLKPAPEREIELLIAQVQGGLITVNEARRIRNMDPIAGGDTLRGAQSSGPPSATPDPAQGQPTKEEASA